MKALCRTSRQRAQVDLLALGQLEALYRVDRYLDTTHNNCDRKHTLPNKCDYEVGKNSLPQTIHMSSLSSPNLVADWRLHG